MESMKELHDFMQSMIVIGELTGECNLHHFDQSRYYLTLYKGSNRKIINLTRHNKTELHITIQIPNSENGRFDKLMEIINNIDLKRIRTVKVDKLGHHQAYQTVSFVLMPGNKIMTSWFVANLYK